MCFNFYIIITILCVLIVQKCNMEQRNAAKSGLCIVNGFTCFYRKLVDMIVTIRRMGIVSKNLNRMKLNTLVIKKRLTARVLLRVLSVTFNWSK